MYFSYVHICAILSDDRIYNGAVKTLITKIAEEWVMINSRGFQENATFQRIQLFCFFYFRNSSCKGIHITMQDFIRFSYKLLVWKCNRHPGEVSTTSIPTEMNKSSGPILKDNTLCFTWCLSGTVRHGKYFR